MAWPTVLTMTSYTIMQFVDKLMVAQVSPLHLAAQGNGGIWAFTPIAFALGATTVVNTYVSQNLGAGTPREGPKYVWAAVWLSVAVWIVALLPFALAMPWMFKSMGHRPQLAHMESGYGQILLVGAVFLLAGRGLHQYFFGIHGSFFAKAAAHVRGDNPHFGIGASQLMGQLLPYLVRLLG